MKTSLPIVVILSGLALPSLARDVPVNIRNFYNSLKSKGTCSNKLATGFYSNYDGGASFSYCGDRMTDYNIVYLQGTGGTFANMDIDCDGEQNGVGNDGRCGKSTDTQAITSFADTVAGYNKGIRDLNAYVHSYAVFGNEGTKSGWKTFNPESYGIRPLSLMAVVCGDKMFYGVWGDENGDDGDRPMVGEASISLATACFGTGINGNSGHDEDDVLYIAFPGADAVPGANGANWGASSFTAFHDSISALGDRLISRIGGATPPTTTRTTTSATATPRTTTSSKTTSRTTTALPPAATCAWPGHCAGAACTTYDDCSDDLDCIGGKCT